MYINFINWRREIIILNDWVKSTLMALKIKLLLNVSALLFFLKISFGAEKFSESDSLFLDQKPLKIKINYSNKNLNKNTNDSTFY